MIYSGIHTRCMFDINLKLKIFHIKYNLVGGVQKVTTIPQFSNRIEIGDEAAFYMNGKANTHFVRTRGNILDFNYDTVHRCRAVRDRFTGTIRPQVSGTEYRCRMATEISGSHTRIFSLWGYIKVFLTSKRNIEDLCDRIIEEFQIFVKTQLIYCKLFQRDAKENWSLN